MIWKAFALVDAHAGVLDGLFFRLGVFLVLVVSDDQNGFFLDFFFRLGLFGLLGFFLGVFFLVAHTLRDRRSRLGLARTPLFVKRLGLECESAFRALDRPLLEVVKSRTATRANALYSKICLDQGHASRVNSVFEGRVVCHGEGRPVKAGFPECRFLTPCARSLRTAPGL